MRGKKSNRFLISLLGVLLLLSIIPFTGYAAVPQTVNYQGYLTDSGGNPVNGAVGMQFSIYNVSTGGTALWTETQTVTVSNGIYSMILGSVNPINLAFNEQYYLGVKVGADAEMTPRQPLTSVGYAFTADTLGGGAVNVASSGNVGIGTTTPGAKLDVAGSGKIADQLEVATSGAWANLFLNGGSGGQFQFLQGGSTKWSIYNAGGVNLSFKYAPTDTAVMYLTSSGNVGIGTTSPVNPLHVIGEPYFSGGLRIVNGQKITNDMASPTSMTLDDYMQLTVNGSEALRINSGGNIGIGTATPGAKLEVAGQVKITGGTPGTGKVLTSDANGLATWETGAGGGSSISAGDSNVTVTDVGDGYITFTEDNAEKMRITGGNVCIGCTLPGGIKLRVAGGNIALVAGASGSIQLAHNPADDGGCSFNYNSPKLAFWGCVGNVTGPSIQKVDRGLGYGKGDLVFYQHQTDDTSGEYEAMRLTYDGNVGIGTTSPSAKLDVAGKIKSQNARAQVKGYTEITTNSQTWTDMPGMSLSITTGASDILVSLVIGGLRQSGNINLGYFRIVLDGTEIWQTEGIRDVAYPNQVVASQYESVSAGSHTITVQWRVGNSSDTIYAGANTSTRNLTVIELF